MHSKLVLGCVLLLGTLGAQAQEAEPTLRVGSRAPALTAAHWIRGAEVQQLTQGRVYVLEFWATWCRPCIAAIPELAALQQQHNADLTVIGITSEKLADAVAFLAKPHPTSGRTAYDTAAYSLAADPDGSTQKAYLSAAGLAQIPTSFLVGRDGKIAWIGHPGQLAAPLAAALAEPWDPAVHAAREAAARDIARVRPQLQAAVNAGRTQEAVRLLDGLLEKYPRHVGIGYEKFMLLQRAQRFDAAYLFAYKFADRVWDDADALNQIAWTVVDDKEVGHRDLEFALKVARRGVELTKERQDAVLDTLARVHFEAGRLDEALAWQAKAVAVAGADATGDAVRAVMARYRAAAQGTK